MTFGMAFRRSAYGESQAGPWDASVPRKDINQSLPIVWEDLLQQQSGNVGS